MNNKLIFDEDGLVAGCSISEFACDFEHGWAKVYGVWYALDERLPWQFTEVLKGKVPKGMDIRVRINPNKTAKDSEVFDYFRKARWWGAEFSWDKIDAGESGFTTVHGDPESSIHKLNWVEKTKFSWEFPQDEQIGIFKLEEFKLSPDEKNEAFKTRFAHSIRDQKNRFFSHLDFAIKTFQSEGKYSEAYSDKWIKADGYEKVFRLDAKIDQEKWLRLIEAFFADNYLVAEYFGADFSAYSKVGM